ncbi:hypothetical protein G4B88_008570 [Cannabis sativa]|uniref:Uncharacterized protein n=1 Tax=Cannabis sativa TaxID=3483 RepID=A0A7J6FC46_CANSA|nr:hypothetical protein G4B88_008570 [Cannabis sativa]
MELIVFCQIQNILDTYGVQEKLLTLVESDSWYHPKVERGFDEKDFLLLATTILRSMGTSVAPVDCMGSLSTDFL